MSNTTLRQNQKNQLNNTGINQQKLRAFADELAKDIHTQDDLADLSASLVKMTIEAALSAKRLTSSWLSKATFNNSYMI